MTGHRRRKAKKIVAGLFACLLLAALAVTCWLGNVLIDVALCRPQESIWENDAYASVEADVEASYVISDETQENMLEAYEKRQSWLVRVKPERVALTSHDGYELVANVYPGSPKSRKWALLLHGYGYTGKKEEMEYIGAEYAAQGYWVLAPDLRCHGESQGDFIGMGWTDRQDILQWIDYIVSQDKQAKIVLHGQSMGGAAALMTAGEKLPDQVKAVVSDCAYTSVWDIFSRKLKDWYDVGPFPILYETNLIFQLRGGYNLKKASVLAQVAKSRLPILFIHGEADDFVPVSMARELYEKAAGPKELLTVPGAGHGLSNYVDPDAYYGKVFSFLENIYGG
ncbi:MAG: alpha/beta hydrolase [Lachnospiraceae bacterium]|nr:alpha/beta hydrolase [Lachnospiraceae bacterium]